MTIRTVASSEGEKIDQSKGSGRTKRSGCRYNKSVYTLKRKSRMFSVFSILYIKLFIV